MIQIITYRKSKFSNYDNKYKISSIDEFESFDDFDINIIDLTEEGIWRNTEPKCNEIDNSKDLRTLSKEISSVKKAKIVISFPQNIVFKYSWDFYNKVYGKSAKIKDIIPSVIGIITNNLLIIQGFELSYSKNTTTINEYSFKSDFNLNEQVKDTLKIVTKSDNSNKITTALYKNMIITTLNIFETNEHLNIFLSPFTICDNSELIPKWLENINFFNDEQLKNEKNNNKNKITELESSNTKIDEELEKNNKFKSILYSTGNELVNVVIEILDHILEYDSSNFIDEKKEDFLIKKEDVTFVGEIKGVSSAINNQNVSQLDVHVQGYIDRITKDTLNENVKGLLIINHQRTKELSLRNEIHNNQINLAIRNNSLIIETKTLLKLYEIYLQGKIDTAQIIKMLKEKNGVLLEEDFIKK